LLQFSQCFSFSFECDIEASFFFFFFFFFLVVRKRFRVFDRFRVSSITLGGRGEGGETRIHFALLPEMSDHVASKRAAF
jgi:hypothetical protein